VISTQRLAGPMPDRQMGLPLSAVLTERIVIDLDSGEAPLLYVPHSPCKPKRLGERVKLVGRRHVSPMCDAHIVPLAKGC
jgi:hypothetical protein